MKTGRLIIERKEDEAFYLSLPNGDQVKVTLHEYRDDKTAVMIEAPDDITVVREELLAN